MTTEKYVLSIDLGTSGSKSAIVSVHGDVIDFDFEAVPLLLLPDGGAEQKPDDWWRAVAAFDYVLEQDWIGADERLEAHVGRGGQQLAVGDWWGRLG